MLGTPSSGPLRITRGLACALVNVVLGGTAHALAAGHPPGLLVSVIAVCALGLVCGCLAESERGFAFIAAVLGGAQLFLHLAFSMASAPPSSLSWSGHAGSLAGHGGHHSLGASASIAGVAGDAGSHGAGPVLGLSSSAMLLGHVLATLGAAACLAYGERAMWRLARLVVPLLWPLLRLASVPILIAPSRRPQSLIVLPLRGVLLARCVPRRGPPGYVLA
jgi:hypothetical protein